jgi:uncharacterized protein YjbI with pentapeptide repeats
MQNQPLGRLCVDLEEKPMRLGAISAAALAVVASLCVAAPSLSWADDSAATVTLVNPIAELNGVKIESISATLDGDGFGGCDAERRQLFSTCVKAQEIHSGPHVLEVVLNSGRNANLASFVVKFTAGLTGKWVFDIKGSTATNARESDYFHESAGSVPAEGCLASLARVSRISSCTLAGMDALAPALSEAAAACKGAVVEDDGVERALTEIGENLFSVRVSQCYAPAELEKLPKRLFVSGLEEYERGSGEYAGWPADTLTDSSWAWARDVVPELPPTPKVATALEKFQNALPELAKRFAVVEGIATGYLTGDTGPVLKAAEQQGWSLDPTTPEGQRNFLLLSDPERFADQAYGDFVAAKVAADGQLDCDRTLWQSELLVGYLTAGRKLSPTGWKAALAMAERTPGDGEFDFCAWAFSPLVESPIAVDERVHRFFELDCSTKRLSELRGSALKNVLNQSYVHGTHLLPAGNVEDTEFDLGPDLREKVEKDFASCLAGNVQAVAAAESASVLDNAVKRGCKIGPAARCSGIDLEGADLHGADLHGADLTRAKLVKANLQGANFQDANLSSTNLIGAILTGVKFKGANLTEIFAQNLDLHAMDFEGVSTMQRAYLRKSDLHGDNFHGVDLTGADLQETNLEGINLQAADLSSVRFYKANLMKADLRGAKLTRANLDHAQLQGADLRGDNLMDVNLSFADLTGANLAGVDFQGAFIQYVGMTSVDLHGANFRNAQFSDTHLEKADLSGADLGDANLIEGDFRGANLAGANLKGVRTRYSYYGRKQADGTPVADQFEGANLSNAIWVDGHKCPPGTIGGDACEAKPH